MRNHILESLLTASVNSHITDPQAKWTHSINTSAMINAFTEASGVPYWAANIVVMEKCADHWLGCIADISRSFLRPNLASHPFVVTETICGRVNIKAHKVSGTMTQLVEHFISPWGDKVSDRLAMTHSEKATAFFAFLYARLIEKPDLLAGYAPEVRQWADAGIADLLPAGELKRIESEIKHKAEVAERAAIAAREQRAAEDAARAKRAAAAAARKQRAKGGAA